MRINAFNFNNFKLNQASITRGGGQKYSNLTPLASDCISFGAMKKREFNGIDYAVVERLNAPIEKFNSNEDMQNWAQTKINEITSKDYGGRTDETRTHKKGVLEDWTKYLSSENCIYSPAIQLFILDSITRNLKPDDDKVPPTLSRNVLNIVVNDLQNKLAQNPKQQFNFTKIYKEKLISYYLEKENMPDGTGWIKIPSYEHDPEHFEENVEELKSLSCDSWCTKSYKADVYLKEGDFFAYYENQKPKIGMRISKWDIAEIQGELNNTKIPQEYIDVVEDFINENHFSLSSKARKEIDEIRIPQAIEREKEKLVDNAGAKEIFSAYGIEYKELDDGFLEIDSYHQPNSQMSFSDLGIDENELLKSVKYIKNDADFRDSKLTKLENIEYIGGNADFYKSNIESIGELKQIGGNAFFGNSQITNLDKLEYVGGICSFNKSKITDFGNLKAIKGDAEFYGVEAQDLGNLEYIGGKGNFENTKIASLGKLKYIGGNATFQMAKTTDLGELRYIGGNANFDFSKVENLGKLEYVGDLNYSRFNYKQKGQLEQLSDYTQENYTQNFKNILREYSQVA